MYTNINFRVTASATFKSEVKHGRRDSRSNLRAAVVNSEDPCARLICAIINQALEDRDTAYVLSDSCKWHCNILGLDYEKYRDSFLRVCEIPKKRYHPKGGFIKATTEIRDAIRSCPEDASIEELALKYNMSCTTVRFYLYTETEDYTARRMCCDCHKILSVYNFDIIQEHKAFRSQYKRVCRNCLGKRKGGRKQCF